jgi:hypothetical protein
VDKRTTRASLARYATQQWIVVHRATQQDPSVDDLASPLAGDHRVEVQLGDLGEQLGQPRRAGPLG